ncbi:MAG: glycoside hydrolase [Candidatus Rokuibacteriota bacterium]|nr:MAG: glycoside hydrolase [Candidatus Rokubacteria bacterium]
MSADNRILDIVNTYEKISFDVGPTLLSWLERQRPDVYAKILEADRLSRRARGGHGNAIAQVYNHAIMPLCTRRDKVTQVRWGIEDFRHRFGRDPEGMWLPETAADGESLEVLAEAGIKFTILAPHQARRIRPLDEATWRDVGDKIDPSRAYHWRGPGGPSLALFFYDTAISRAIAFGDALSRGEVLVERLRGGLSENRAWPQLVHCATDGESYGHHTRFGDMALAAALEQIERERFATLTNHGAFLEAHPPTHEAEIHDNFSWSCPHGVERWRADCGCRTRGDRHQRWRGPLRAALDWLRDQVDLLFERRADLLLKDPWEARDDYIRVVLDRSRDTLGDYFARHRRRPLDASEQVAAIRLLEMQRQRLLMYTSCGWFFDEISGLEPVQIQKYAAMAIQYVRSLGGGALEEEFLRRLATAPSNLPEFGDGAGTYRRLVRPAVVDLRRVVAHYAISSLFESYGQEERIYCYAVRRLDEQVDADGGTALRIGRVSVRAEITGETDEAAYAVLHYGGHDFHCGVHSFTGAEAYDAMVADLRQRYARGSVSDLVRALDRHFPGEPYTLRHLFLEERRKILARVTESVLERNEVAYRRIWEENRKLMRYLRDADATVPEALTMVARHVLAHDITLELGPVEMTGTVPERVVELMDEAQALGLSLDMSAASPPMRRAVARAMDVLTADPTPERVRAALALIECAQRLGVRFGLWETQNRFFEVWRGRPEARDALRPMADRLGFHLEP